MADNSSKRENLVSKVYDYVLNMILTQEIKCGERIPETMIVEKLGISRTPIREAMRRLANSGIIKIYPKRFAEVITFSEQDVKDLGFIRIMLDTMAAQLAIVNGSNADFARLKSLTDVCMSKEKEGDRLGSINLDCESHMILSDIAGNSSLIDMQRDLYLKVELLLATTETSKQDRIDSINHHYEIIEMLYKRDAKGVIAAIYEHLAKFYKLDLEKYRTMTFNINDIAKMRK